MLLFVVFRLSISVTSRGIFLEKGTKVDGVISRCFRDRRRRSWNNRRCPDSFVVPIVQTWGNVRDTPGTGNVTAICPDCSGETGSRSSYHVSISSSEYFKLIKPIVEDSSNVVKSASAICKRLLRFFYWPNSNRISRRIFNKQTASFCAFKNFHERHLTWNETWIENFVS